MESDNSRSVFDVLAEAAALPSTATTMLVDKYFVDKPAASARIFRIYREVPLHYHEECDEHLYLLSGGGTFHLDGAEFEARPGMFLCFERRKVHGFPRITADSGVDVEQFYEVLNRNHGTYVGPGHWFGQDRRYFRLGFAWPETDELERGLAGLSAAAATAISSH